MEYIEKDPLILSNFGMVSKIERWIYITRLASYVLRKHGYNPGKGQDPVIFNNLKDLKKIFYVTIKNLFGRKGAEIYMTEKMNLPTLG